MFSKNLRYYRLKCNMSKKELAACCGITPMAISNYESGNRKPDMDILKKLAAALNVKVSDFLISRNQHLEFVHGEFRKASGLSKTQQEYVRESVEEYFSRFYTAMEILGGDVVPEPPTCHKLFLSGDVETDARSLRHHLGLAEEGPVDDLVGMLENKGILVFELSEADKSFSGMNGSVNDRPYIAFNPKMSAERNRSTIVHELAHLMFIWPKKASEKEIEDTATAISGAFLLPASDLKRELGLYRKAVNKDMEMVCREYGISMYLLVKRATICGIINKSTARDFYVKANKAGWHFNEPSRIEKETATLFEQLVYRAVNEDDISMQRGAELLNVSVGDLAANCSYNGGGR